MPVAFSEVVPSGSDKDFNKLGVTTYVIFTASEIDARERAKSHDISEVILIVRSEFALMPTAKLLFSVLEMFAG